MCSRQPSSSSRLLLYTGRSTKCASGRSSRICYRPNSCNQCRDTIAQTLGNPPMRDRWYGDNRDLVKWATLLHLAHTNRVGTILQVAMYRADKPDEPPQLLMNG